jgi:molybdopterin-guanine dinucleotide biosynthesis protein A
VLDDPSIGGPLAGLAATLAYASGRGAGLLLTLPCDMPRLPADLGARLAQALTPAHGAALAAADGRVYPVCGLWRTACLEKLPAYVADGRSSLWGFAEACGLAVADWGPQGAPAFANVNSPDDLERLSGV